MNFLHITLHKEVLCTKMSVSPSILPTVQNVRVFIKYLITLGYLLRTKRLRAYNL